MDDISPSEIHQQTTLLLHLLCSVGDRRINTASQLLLNMKQQLDGDDYLALRLLIRGDVHHITHPVNKGVVLRAQFIVDNTVPVIAQDTERASRPAAGRVSTGLCRPAMLFIRDFMPGLSSFWPTLPRQKESA